MRFLGSGIMSPYPIDQAHKTSNLFYVHSLAALHLIIHPLRSNKYKRFVTERRIRLAGETLVSYSLLLPEQFDMKKLLTSAVLSGCLATSAGIHAAEFDFSGNFDRDNDVTRFGFSVRATSVVTLFSSSWLNGGFDPILTLWDGGGNLLFEQDDGDGGGSALSNGMVFGYGDFDSYLSVELEPGNYITTLTQYDNFSVSDFLFDGFLRDGDPTFTESFGCSNGIFCSGLSTDGNGNSVQANRTSAWELHILNVDSAQLSTVPEPPTLLLGLAGLFVWGGRRGRSNAA